MAVLNFDTGPFWEQRLASIRRQLTGPGYSHRPRAEPEEVIGHVYENLKRRRPNGLIEGDNPEAYLNLTIVAESRKCLRDDLMPPRRCAGTPLIPIEAVEEPEGDVGEPVLRALIAGEEFEELRRTIDRLPTAAREIVRDYYGLDGPELTLSAIAKRRGISLQAVAKRRDRALRLIRVLLPRHVS
jgi:DNA-directed RNA polymerase specialized sigma24 family protein